MEKRNVVLYIAESLDGFIATKDDSLEWLLSVEGEGDNGFAEFYDSMDTVIMGRKTYDWIMEHENGKFPYHGKQCFVFSKNQKEDTENVKFINKDIVEFIQNLKTETGSKIWLVGGTQLIKAFQKANLIEEYIVSIAPALIGDGKPLFSSGMKENLHLERVRTFGQFVELTYSVK